MASSRPARPGFPQRHSWLRHSWLLRSSLRHRLGEALVRLGSRLLPGESAALPQPAEPLSTDTLPSVEPPVAPATPVAAAVAASFPSPAAAPPVDSSLAPRESQPPTTELLPPPQRPPSRVEARCPAQREPLSVERAVLQRDMTVLKREASDALAALGAAHALVTSARLAQVQDLRQRFESEEVSADAVLAMAGDYQGWQNDQVRLFDALALVQRMRVPDGFALDQMDAGLHAQARSHLQTLSVEYQRQLLDEQFHEP